MLDTVQEVSLSADIPQPGAGRSIVVTLLPIMAAVFVAFLVIGLAMPVLPLHVHDGLGLGTFVVGLVAGAQFAASLLSRFWSGSYADRRGGKRTVVMGLLVAAAAGLLYLQSLRFVNPVTSVTILIIGRAILGGAESFIITGALSWGLAIGGPENTGKVMAWIGTAMYVAFAIGAPAGSALYAVYGFTALALATMLIPLVTLLLVAPRPAAVPSSQTRSSFTKVVGAVWAPGFGLALSSIGFGAITTFAVLFFAQRGWGFAWLALTVFALTFVAARVFFSHLADCIGGAKVALVSALIEAAGLAIIWLSPWPTLAFIGAAVTGFGYSLVYPGFGVEAVRRAPAESRGLAMGAYTAFLDLALGLANPALGLLASRHGLRAVFFVSALVVACSAAIAVRLLPNNPLNEKREIVRRNTSKILLAIMLMPSVLIGRSAYAQTESGLGETTEWLNYGGDKASSKYSPLGQIRTDNFDRLKVAWTWRSAEEAITKANPDLKTWVWEATPLMVGGVLYVSTSLSQVAAIDATTGETKWVFDPETWKKGTPSNNGFVHRGVAYWADGDDQRILFGTGDGYLIALNAKIGKPVLTFGKQGRIDLTQGLGRPVERRLYGVSSPPIIIRDIVVMGSKVHDVPLVKEMPPGDVRGFDVRTGKQRWRFRAIPSKGEFGNDTWKQNSWKTTGSANVWTMMSADEDLGYVYLPFSTPSDDNYGGQRPGDGLFGESLVCLDARTGKRIWHFQMVHHGLWDYDPPAAPNLIDIQVNGKRVKAIAQVSKQGFVYVFDRVSGKPIWPIEERAVPQSTAPGEQSSATQPFPTKPAPFDRQGISENDLIDFTPELRKAALSVLNKYNYGPLFTPPSLQKPTIMMPGIAGGASWAGAAYDPETGIFYVPSNTIPYAVTLNKSETAGFDYVGRVAPLETVQGIPIWKPPYGRITAIDMNTGDHQWMAPVGDIAQSNPVLKQLNLSSLGRSARTHVLLTKTLLIVAQEGTTRREENLQRGPGSERGVTAGTNFEIYAPELLAYDKATGKLVGAVTLPRNATGAPMTYMLNSKQFIIVPTGGANLPPELIVLGLP